MRKHRVETDARYDSKEGGNVLCIIKEVLPFHEAIRMEQKLPNERDNGMFFFLSPIRIKARTIQTDEWNGHSDRVTHREADARYQPPRGFNVTCDAERARVALRDPLSKQGRCHRE